MPLPWGEVQLGEAECALPPRCDPDTGIILRIWASPFVFPCFTYFASALASTLAQTLHLSRVRLLFRTRAPPLQLVGQICMSLLATDIFDTLPQSWLARPHINGDRRLQREVFCQLSIRARSLGETAWEAHGFLQLPRCNRVKGFCCTSHPLPALHLTY